ncbi:MAG: sugar-transfer associated ATP-grasp domain-containing protein [Oleiphilaceae bacterium]|nr:sugar-transfer associated ATP-grasp domain-containing protein [Oleiphilaceae bacterium]
MIQTKGQAVVTTRYRDLTTVGIRAPVSPYRRLYRGLRDTLLIARVIPPLAAQTGKSHWHLFTTALELHYRYGFTPKEIRNNGIIHGSNPLEAARTRISKQSLVALQARLNPSSLECLTEDKAVFQTLMEAYRLPVLPTVAVFFRGSQGHTVNGDFPTSSQQWLTALRRCLPAEFVLKPATGALGAGVRVYRREGDELTCQASGQRRTLPELINTLSRDRFFSCYLFQERLLNHPAIQALSDSTALQTVRVVTLLKPGNQVEVLLARLRLVTGKTVTDNFRAGDLGSMLAQIEIRTGRVFEAVQRSPMGHYQCIHQHPATGATLPGFQMPFWPELVKLATAGAKVLSPVRVVGWDIACTASGPVMVEANCRWDPPNERCREGLIRRLIQAIPVDGVQPVADGHRE